MAGLVGLALTSCSEDNPLGTMQKNEAPIVVPVEGVALKSVYQATGNKVVLQDFVESVTVPLVNIELSNDFPAASTVNGQVEIADNPEFTQAQTLSLNSIDAPTTNQALAAAAGGNTRSLLGVVATSQWEDAFVALYGYDPNPKVNYVRYKLWLSNEKQNVILYNDNGEEWFDTMEFTVTPLDVAFDVAANYTLHYLINGADEQSVLMYHNPDTHQYDDPNFKASVEVEEGQTILWWITEGEGNTGTPYGVSTETPGAASGDLGIVDQTNFGSGEIAEAGVYQIEVNMLDLTYNVKLAPKSLYVLYSGAQFTDAGQLGTTDFISYTGTAGLLGNFTLTGQANYRPTLYVNDAKVSTTTDGNTVTGGIMSATGGATDASANPIPYGKAGLYYFDINIQNLTYSKYYCSTIGVVGSMTDWADGADIALKASRTTQYCVWTGTITLNAGDQFKIRANNEWGPVNLGSNANTVFSTNGQPIELYMGGDSGNLEATESGTYTITVYLKRQIQEDGTMSPYYMTLTPAE